MGGRWKRKESEDDGAQKGHRSAMRRAATDVEDHLDVPPAHPGEGRTQARPLGATPPTLAEIRLQAMQIRAFRQGSPGRPAAGAEASSERFSCYPPRMPAASPGPLVSLSGPLIPSGPSDRYFDYCLQPYKPRRPWRGKSRGENLLWQSLRHGGVYDSLEAPFRAVQRSLGADMTVWGVKWDGARLFWELYFYDPQREDTTSRLPSLTRVLEPWFEVTPRPPDAVPYMMVSLDFSERTLDSGRIEEVNLYLAGERHHAGRSYRVRADGAELENTYRFFEAKPESDQIIELLRSSLFVDHSDERTLSKVLIPELFACKRICVAKKRTCDAVYYSGITVEQLSWFLGRFDYPREIRDFVKQHEAQFEHLYFDVGIDYRTDPETGALTYRKSSYYGTL